MRQNQNFNSALLTSNLNPSRPLTCVKPRLSVQTAAAPRCPTLRLCKAPRGTSRACGRTVIPSCTLLFPVLALYALTTCGGQAIRGTVCSPADEFKEEVQARLEGRFRIWARKCGVLDKENGLVWRTRVWALGWQIPLELQTYHPLEKGAL